MSFLDHFMSKKETLPTYEEKVHATEKESEFREILIKNIEEEKKLHVNDAAIIDMFLESLLKDIPEYARHCQKAEDANQAAEDDNSGGTPEKVSVDASVKLFLSPDKMTAYACIFPPFEGGKDIQVASLMEDIKYEGIKSGIQEKVIVRMVQQKSYFTIFAAARGTAPKHGEAGQITDYAPRKESNLFASKNGVVVFDETQVFPIQKGGIICRIQEPTKGVDGIDVTGRVLPGNDGEAIIVPKGKNTMITSEGKKLTATVDGRLYFKDGCFCVDKMAVINRDLEKQLRPLDYSGSLLVDGNILSGAIIRTKGDIIVTGTVSDVELYAGGSILIQKGMSGRSKAKITAAGDIQCLSIEDALLAESGGSIYAEVIINSTVKAQKNVYAVTGRGQIAGGSTYAGRSIYAKRIGNQANYDNMLIIGYKEGQDKELAQLQNKLSETISTSDKIKRNISTLKCIPHLPEEKQEVLNLLIEQRTLYSKTEEKLTQQIKTLKASMIPGKESVVICEELYPVTKVSLSSKTLTLRNPETNCRVQLHADSLILKSLPSVSFEGI